MLNSEQPNPLLNIIMK